MARKNSLPQKTKKDVMVEILRDAILSGELQPGERLLQEELAERFNVSPTPIREAIQQLTAEGVLSHSPYRGVQVAEIDLHEVQEVYLIRGVLERLATRLAVPNLKLSDVQHLRTLHAELEAEVEKGEPASLLKINREFHMLIYDAASAPTLHQMIKSLWIKTPWDTPLVIPNRTRMMVEEHRRILDAINSADAELAGQAMQDHIETVASTLANYLKNRE
jgi:DNA-binding GntR family transcriptional regulator